MSVLSNGTEVLIDPYVTVAGYPGADKIPSGIWHFHCYHYAASTGGDSRIVYRIFKRTSGGVETELFNVTTVEINATSVLEYDTDYVLVSDIPLSTTDRIVVKMYAKSTANQTIHFVYSGATHTSHVVTTLHVQGAVGPAGPTGPTGPTGPSGVPSGYMILGASDSETPADYTDSAKTITGTDLTVYKVYIKN